VIHPAFLNAEGVCRAAKALPGLQQPSLEAQRKLLAKRAGAKGLSISMHVRDLTHVHTHAHTTPPRISG
jgi:hypothetical protein